MLEDDRLKRSPSITRRELLKILVAAGLGGVLASSSVTALAAESSVSREARRYYVYKRDNYNTDILTAAADQYNDGKYRGSGISDYEMRKSIQALRRELVVYPTALLEKAKIKKIIILRNLQAKRNLDWLNINGSSNWQTGFILLDSFGSDWYKFSTLHHEIFHLLDRDSDNLAWASLNKNGDKAYVAKHGLGCDTPDNLQAGFIDVYGSCSVNEDQATITQALFWDSTESIQNRAAKDPVLTTKIQRIKQFYLEKSNGLMDEQYWRDLDTGIVRRAGESYWGNPKKRI